MREIFSTILISIFVLFSAIKVSSAGESLEQSELNVFSGMFDFSDDKQASGVFG